MMFYYGQELMEKLTDYYGRRLQAARKQGFADERAQYHWLFQELDYRVNLLRQAHMFMEALPPYLAMKKPDEVMAYVTQYAGAWFQEKNIGTLPQDAQGRCAFFSDSNPYWSAISEILTMLEQDTDTAILPLFQLNLCEYVVRNVRLYFFLREKQYRPIDRNQFDAVMSLRD